MSMLPKKQEKTRSIAATTKRAENGTFGTGALYSSEKYITTLDELRQEHGGITAILPAGKEYAVTAKQLTSILGVSEQRVITLMIERERLNGSPICACTRGYYLPNAPEELKKYLREFRSRHRRIGKTAEALEYALAQMQGQEVINEQNKKEAVASMGE